MLERLRTPTATWLLVLAAVLSAWSLGIGWRTPELVAVQGGVAPLLEGLRDGPLVGSILLVRVLTLGLWVGVAVRLGRTLRAATGWSLAPSVAPLTGALLLALPLSARLLVDVRALAWVLSAWALLTAMELALTALDHPRRRLRWVLANLAAAVGLALLEEPLALLTAALVTGLLVVPHRHRHALGLRRLPSLGILAGLVIAVIRTPDLAGALPPLSWTAAFAGPELPSSLRMAVHGALLLALGLGLAAQRPYRQSLLTLLALAGACALLEPKVPGASYPAALLATAALALTTNAEAPRAGRGGPRLATLAWSVLVLAGGAATLVLARAHWSQHAHADALRAGIVAELDAEARATRGLQLDVLLRTAGPAPSPTALRWAPLGRPMVAGPEVFLALTAPFDARELSFAERLAATRIGSTSEHGSHGAELFPVSLDPTRAPRPRLLLQASLAADGSTEIERTELPGHPVPIAEVRAVRQPDGSLAFDPPVPAYLIRELRVALPEEPVDGRLVAHFGAPDAPDRLEHAVPLSLPSGPAGRRVPLALPTPTTTVDWPPLTRLELRPMALILAPPPVSDSTQQAVPPSTPTLNAMLLDVELRTAPTYVYLISPDPLEVWDLRADSSPPSILGSLSGPGPPLLRGVRYEARLFVSAGPAPLPAQLFPTGQAPTALAADRPPGWDLVLSSGVHSQHVNQYASSGPRLLGPTDPALASRRAPWSTYLGTGLAQALAKAGHELEARFQVTLLGPGDLVLARSAELPLRIRTDAAPPSVPESTD